MANDVEKKWNTPSAVVFVVMFVGAVALLIAGAVQDDAKLVTEGAGALAVAIAIAAPQPLTRDR
jgi:hypothetical protein